MVQLHPALAAPVGVIVGIVIAVGAIWVAPRVRDAVTRLGRRRTFLAVDAAVASFSTLCALALLPWGQLLPQWKWIYGALALAGAAALFGRVYVALHTAPSNYADTALTRLFDSTVGRQGFDALPNLESDGLGRKPFADVLEAIVARRHHTPLVVGLERKLGDWQNNDPERVARPIVGERPDRCPI